MTAVEGNVSVYPVIELVALYNSSKEVSSATVFFSLLFDADWVKLDAALFFSPSRFDALWCNKTRKYCIHVFRESLPRTNRLKTQQFLGYSYSNTPESCAQTIDIATLKRQSFKVNRP